MEEIRGRRGQSQLMIRALSNFNLRRFNLTLRPSFLSHTSEKRAIASKPAGCLPKPSGHPITKNLTAARQPRRPRTPPAPRVRACALCQVRRGRFLLADGETSKRAARSTMCMPPMKVDASLLRDISAQRPAVLLEVELPPYGALQQPLPPTSLWHIAFVLVMRLVMCANQHMGFVIKLLVMVVGRLLWWGAKNLVMKVIHLVWWVVKPHVMRAIPIISRFIWNCLIRMALDIMIDVTFQALGMLDEPYRMLGHCVKSVVGTILTYGA